MSMFLSVSLSSVAVVLSGICLCDGLSLCVVVIRGAVGPFGSVCPLSGVIVLSMWCLSSW